MTNVCAHCLAPENAFGNTWHRADCPASAYAEIETLRQQVAALVLERDAALRHVAVLQAVVSALAAEEDDGDVLGALSEWDVADVFRVLAAHITAAREALEGS